MVRAAVWDLGSSSFHVLACDRRGCQGLETVLRRRALLNLGHSVGATGAVPADRVATSVSAAKRLRRALDDVRPDVVVAYATAALRDAGNGAEVVGRLERVIGRPVEVLDGAEEARLCFVGQRAGVWTGPGPSVGMDLGGGSFEVAVGGDGGLDYATSAPVGATRLWGELAVADPLRPEDSERIRERTVAAAAPVTEALGSFPGVARRAVVSGGTARALARLATATTREHQDRGSPEVNQVELPAAQVAEMADRLGRLDLEHRLALPGMPARRAPMLPIGAAILATLAEELGVERYVVSVWGLREGALLDAMARG